MKAELQIEWFQIKHKNTKEGINIDNFKNPKIKKNIKQKDKKLKGEEAWKNTLKACMKQ